MVLGFYANDFEDNIKAGLFRLNDGGVLAAAKKKHIPAVTVQNLIYGLPMVAWLGENSYFYSVLFNSAWRFFKTKLTDNTVEAVTEYAIPTTSENSSNEIELTNALLRRMYEFCKGRGIRLIILDIPRISGSSSFPLSILENISELSDIYVDGSALLINYSDVAELHRPHGSRHITEFSHIVLGVNAAKQIDTWLESRTPVEY